MRIRHRSHIFELVAGYRGHDIVMHAMECGCGNSIDSEKAFEELMDVEEKFYDNGDTLNYAGLTLAEFFIKLGYECTNL